MAKRASSRRKKAARSAGTSWAERASLEMETIGEQLRGNYAGFSKPLSACGHVRDLLSVLKRIFSRDKIIRMSLGETTSAFEEII